MANNGWVLAVDVGGTTMKSALVDAEGRIQAVDRRATGREESGEAVVERILAFVDELIAKARATQGADQIRAIGLAVPGLVDEANGIAVEAANLAWNRVPLVRLVEERTGLPATLGHDVRVAGLAEGRIGCAAGVNDYLFVALGTGIGADVVLSGTAYIGAHSVGGEFGHMVVDPDGPQCSCGRRGCVEAFASAGAIERMYLAQRPDAGPVTARDVVDRAGEGDRTATQIWREAVAALALAIANYAVLLDPEMVVVGGGLASAGDALFTPLREHVRGQIIFGPGPRIEPAAMGSDAGVIGAGLMAWQMVQDGQSNPHG